MSSLRKLIVVDSFAASRIRELRLDGHIHIAGRNGRGKTTLIRLIPLFYGEQPSRIVRSSGNVVRTLQDFMFSRPTSYVAFEYENADGIKLAILHYGSDGAQYHLADGEYNRELFVDKEAFVEGRHLNARLRTLGRRPSSALGVLQYRAVIQGTAGQLGMTDLRPLVQRFALASSKSRLKGIERISSGMFSKDITFSALKEMAASVAFDEENKEIALKLSRKEIEEFLPDFKAYKAVMELEAAYRAGNGAQMQAQFELKRRGVAAGRLKCLVLALGRHHDELRRGVSREEEALSQLNRAAQQTLADFEQKTLILQNQVDQLNAQITAIDREEKDWEKQKIQRLSRLVESLPALEAEVRRLEDLRRTLLARVDSVDQKYKALFSEEKARRTQMRADAESRSNAAIAALNSEIDALRERFDAGQAQMRGGHDVEIAAAAEQLEQVRDQVATWNRHLAEIQPAPELKAAAAQADLATQSANHELAAAHQRVADARLHEAQSQNALAQCDQAVILAAQKHSRSSEQLEHLLSLENAGKATLLHYLRENRRDWHEDIAKVIREDLLLREDLNPTAADGESLYGLALTLPRIEAGRAANEAALTIDVEVTRAAESAAATIWVEATLAAKTARNTLEATRQALDAGIESAALAKDHASQMQETLASTRRSVNSEMDDRRRTARAARTESESLLKLRQAALAGLRDAHQRAQSRLQAEFAHEGAAIEQRRKSEASRLIEELNSLEQKASDARQGLEKLRLAELSKSGIDTNALKPLEAQLGNTQSQLEEARTRTHTVESYHRWLDERPAHRIECRHRIEQHKSDRNLRVREREEQKTLEAGRITTQTAVVERSRQDRQDGYARLQNAEDAQRARLADSDDEAAAVHDSVALTWLLPEIISAFDLAHKQAQEQKKLVEKHLGTVMKVFRKTEYSATKVGEYAGHFEASYLTDIPGTLSLLQSWYDTAHLQQRDVLAGKIRSGCGMLRRFQGTLLDFQSSITSLSRQLQDSVESDLVFEAIRSLKLRLSALVERRPYWNALTRVMTEHDKWQADAYAGLPGEALLNELQDFARHLSDGSLAENPNTLMELEIEVDDGNQTKRVRTEADLRQVSSNGLSYLILCLIFVAFANRARRDSELWLTWALDEIGTIDEGNSRALLNMLDRNHIRLVSASPDAKESLQVLFNYRYEILPDFEIQRLLNEDELLPSAVSRQQTATASEATV